MFELKGKVVEDLWMQKQTGAELCLAFLFGKNGLLVIFGCWYINQTISLIFENIEATMYSSKPVSYYNEIGGLPLSPDPNTIAAVFLRAE